MSPETGAVSGSPVAVDPAGCGQTADVTDPAGRLLRRMSVLPALVVTAWLLAALPLLLAGRFTPLLMLVVPVPLAAALLFFGLRWVPDGWQTALPVPKPAQARTPWWAVAGVLAVAAAFAAQQLIYHSQQIIVVRDPAAYVQSAAWIARHGSLPIPQARNAFGGTRGVLSFASPGFFQVGRTVVPQFMTGLPLILAAGFWIGGAATAVALAPVLGAGAVLTFGGLAARLAGPRWAPLAALALALSLPEQFTSRSTYSEPLAQILLLGGLCLIVDSLETGRPGARVAAAVGGLALGLTLLVRIDGASDILPVVPYCGLLLLARRRQALPLFGGVVAGALFGAVDGLVLSRPYLESIKSSLNPLVALGGLVVIVTVIAVAALWYHGLPEVRWKWLLNAAAVLPFVVLLGFAIRPYLHPVPRGTNPRASVLPDGALNAYFAMSLHWVFWYIGIPAVALGTFGAALLVRRCLGGNGPSWTLPLMMFGWIIVTVLYRPAIVPHQPWASRRLVPGVLPGFILLAVWALAWFVAWLGQQEVDRVVRGIMVSGGVAALLLPAAITTFGFKIRDGGPVAVGLAFKTTYRGELAAVDRMCRAIPHGSAVVIVDPWIGSRLAQVIRGMCGDPAATIGHRSFSAVNQVIRGIEQAGRRPVLLAGRPALLTHYSGVPRKIMMLRSRRDETLLMAPPLGTLELTMGVWMSEQVR
jgi:hypothetical protein